MESRRAIPLHLSGCQSAIVFANGDTGLWNAFIDDITRNPHHLSQHQHPFVHRIIQACDPNPPATRKWIRCAENEETFIDMRLPAQQAAIGSHSPIQHQYHSNRSDGRKQLAVQLGIEDRKSGINLPWKNWTL